MSCVLPDIQIVSNPPMGSWYGIDLDCYNIELDDMEFLAEIGMIDITDLTQRVIEFLDYHRGGWHIYYLGYVVHCMSLQDELKHKIQIAEARGSRRIEHDQWNFIRMERVFLERYRIRSLSKYPFLWKMFEDEHRRIVQTDYGSVLRELHQEKIAQLELEMRFNQRYVLSYDPTFLNNNY